jgi:hypothetical protein
MDNVGSQGEGGKACMWSDIFGQIYLKSFSFWSDILGQTCMGRTKIFRYCNDVCIFVVMYMIPAYRSQLAFAYPLKHVHTPVSNPHIPRPEQKLYAGAIISAGVARVSKQSTLVLLNPFASTFSHKKSVIKGFPLFV